VTLVRATLDDAEPLGDVHVQAWRETYAGLVPQRVLDALDPAARARMWRGAIGGDTAVFLAKEAGAIVGFGACAPPREPKLPFDAEISALYLLRHAQRRGLGRALMDAMARALAATGRHSVSLWVMDGNTPAEKFYIALGGRKVTARTRQRDDWTLHETAYAWDDVTRLFQPR